MDYLEDVEKYATDKGISKSDVPMNIKKNIIDYGLDIDKSNGEGLHASQDDDAVAQRSSLRKASNKEFKDRYDALTENQQGEYEKNINTLADENSIHTKNVPIDQRNKIMSQSEEASATERQAEQQPSIPKTEPKITEPDIKLPPTGDDAPPIASDIDKAVATAGETDAELGGPEDIAGDVIALGVGIGSLLFGLHKSHQNSAPPPLLQINPTMQLGEGQD